MHLQHDVGNTYLREYNQDEKIFTPAKKFCTKRTKRHCSVKTTLHVLCTHLQCTVHTLFKVVSAPAMSSHCFVSKTLHKSTMKLICFLLYLLAWRRSWSVHLGSSAWYLSACLCLPACCCLSACWCLSVCFCLPAASPSLSILANGFLRQRLQTRSTIKLN